MWDHEQGRGTQADAGGGAKAPPIPEEAEV